MFLIDLIFRLRPVNKYVMIVTEISLFNPFLYQ